MFIPDTSNFGHHATSINILLRLVELGVQKLSIFYAVGEPGEPTFPKLQRLLPGLGGPDPSGITSLSIGFARITFVQAGLLDQKPLETGLCLTGGWDDSGNVCSTLNVRLHIVLQPFQWSGIEGKVVKSSSYTLQAEEREEISLEGEDLSSSVPGFSDACYYRADPPGIQDTHRLLPDAKELVLLLRTLEFQCEQNRLWLSPVYFSPGRPRAASHIVLFNLVCGFLSAELSQNVVIALMAPVEEDELNRFETLIDSTNSGLCPHSFQRYRNLIGNVVLRRGVPSELDLRTDLVGGVPKIFIYALGMVPQTAFDFLFGASNLVSIFEGAGTTSLALNLGRRYLRLRSADSDGSDFYPCPSVQPGIRGILQQRALACSEALEADEQEWNRRLTTEEYLPGELVANFLVNDEMRNFYTSQRKYFHDQQHDRLLLALLHYQQAFCIEKVIRN